MPTFTGPTEVRSPHWAKSSFERMAYKFTKGRTVWKDASGVWHEQSEPLLSDLAASPKVATTSLPGGYDDRYVFVGGYSYSISQAVADELTTAGYGANIT